MLKSVNWALAFVNSIEKEGGDIQDGIEILRILCSWVASLPGAGSSNALKMEKMIRDGIAKTGSSSQTQEIAVRFFILMVKKKVIRHIDQIIDEIKKILDKKRGVLAVQMEYVFPPEADFENQLAEALKKCTGVSRVDFSRQLKADLIGGYRLKIGDKIIDASISSQLGKLEACLAAGIMSTDAAP